MRSIVQTAPFRIVLVGLVAALGLALPAAAEDFELRSRVEADSLELRTVIGAISVEPHDGRGFEIVVRVRGRDADRDRVRLIENDGRRARVEVAFPLDESNRYVYPALDRGEAKMTLGESGGSWLGWLTGREERIEVRRSGRGLELWTDVTVRVPKDGTLELRHGAGRISADGVRGRLDLDSHAGEVSASRIAGDLRIDTGSGRVTVSDCDAGTVSIDTGSGRVDVTSVAAKRLHVDTGSGRVSASGISADSVLIDTGSGSVELALDTLDGGDFEIDTGSGSVTVALPRGASVDLRADTGSGGIRFDLDTPHDLEQSDDDEARVVIGDGRARMVIDTGSGRIRVGERG